MGPWGPTPPFSTHPRQLKTHKKNLNNQFQTQTINSEKPKSLHTTETLTLAKVGRIMMAKVGLAKVGFDRWEALKAGARPPVPEVSEPGEWLHGWQHHASSSSENHHRETMVLPQSSAADQAISGRIQVQVRVPSSTDRQKGST